MTVVMHYPHAPNSLLLQPNPLLPKRPQPHRMPHNTQPLHALPTRQLRIQRHGPLHDAVRQVQVRLALPVPDLVAAAEDGAAARRTAHEVAQLVLAVVGAGRAGQVLRVVAHEDCLAACGDDGFVLDATQARREQAGAVDDDGGRLAGVVEGRGLGDVRDDVAGEDDSGAAALADEVGEVEGGVDADAGVFEAGVDVRRELGRGKVAELGFC